MGTVKDDAVTVRKTQPCDLPEVIAMIQELADFEKMPNGPQLTVDDLIRDGGFDGQQSAGDGAPVFHSFVLEAATNDPDGPANQKPLQTSMLCPADPARPLTR
uniref:N-acetyltransferase domain-containing protein n=1 Tax=Anopheles christyi TaxID=43041 RepID=A0A182KHF1_9DIPT